MKSIKALIIITLLTCAGHAALAQQDAMYTQYMFNTLAINPAYAGSRNVTSFTALYRDQWVGIEGAPKTATATLDMPIDDKRVGLGVQVFDDKIGITSTAGAFVSYAYRIRFDKGTLSFGLQAGGSQYLANFNSVALNTGGSGDLAFSQNINKWLLDFGTGIYYNTDRFYIGLSSPQMLNNKLDNLSVQGNNSFAGQQMHLFLASGYVFPVGQGLNFKPSVLIKEVSGAPIEADLNATLWIHDIIALGGQYRSDAGVAGMVELQISSQLRLGYSYDMSTTKLVQYNSGSHEIMLRYEFGSQKGKILSPRYF
jgi:type IX secretion system PorP/SprF family membrane protein